MIRDSMKIKFVMAKKLISENRLKYFGGILSSWKIGVPVNRGQEQDEIKSRDN